MRRRNTNPEVRNRKEARTPNFLTCAIFLFAFLSMSVSAQTFASQQLNRGGDVSSPTEPGKSTTGTRTSPPRPPSTEALPTLLLTGATVHTISGETLSPGQVLIRDGKIAGVGDAVAATGATTVDLKGLHLYPGLICLSSSLGLTEIEAVRATEDTTEVGEYTPDVESWVAVNPDSELIPVTRANGIAYFEPVPQGGVISGQSGLVAVEGWTIEQRTIQKPIALHVFWPSMELQVSTRARGRTPAARPKSLEEQARERRGKLQALTEFFEEAKAYAKAKDASARGLANKPAVVPAWEAMLPYVHHELPITVHADEARQIEAAVAWARTNDYRIILAGGRDAWMTASLLATNKVPLIYTHVFTVPSRDTEPYDIHFSTPAVLHQSGVQVSFSPGLRSFDAPLTCNLPYAAAQAVAFGLPEAEAIKGLTLYPAQLAGVAGRLGSIEVGKEATLFAADGNILDLRANVKRMWVAGREINLENRHTRLYDKYKARPK